MVIFVLKNKNMPESFESYLFRLKERRTEDKYQYTDLDFERNLEYIKNCYKKNLSVYKCLEFMYYKQK